MNDEFSSRLIALGYDLSVNSALQFVEPIG